MKTLTALFATTLLATAGLGTTTAPAGKKK